MMQIDKGKLVGAKWVQAADMGGTLLKPRFILIHYTGGGSASGAVSTLAAKDDNYVSAHTVTAADGQVTQLVPFDRQAWHAGESMWGGVRRLNHCAIGLELVNPGYLRPGVTWSHGTRPAAHKFGGLVRVWCLYPDPQFDAAAQQCAALMRTYGTIESADSIVGHDDVAQPRGRKLDPGPVWDWALFRTRVNELLSSG